MGNQQFPKKRGFTNEPNIKPSKTKSKNKSKKGVHINKSTPNDKHPKNPPNLNITNKNNNINNANNTKKSTTNDFINDLLLEMSSTPLPPVTVTVTAPNNNNNNNNGYQLKKKICAYNTNDLDQILEEIHDGNNDNNNNNLSSTVNNNSNNNNSSLLYVEQIANIKHIFKYRKQLGKGGTCRVMLVEKKNKKKNKSKNKSKKKEKYALKELSRSDKFNELLFAKEIQLLKLLSSNVNVVNYYNSYQTSTCYYLATEFCSGGTFLDKILTLKRFSEKDAIPFIKIILNVINEMHNRNIVHRDIKLNNMVFDKPGDNGILKLIDFGDSDIVNDNKIYKELVGTLYYLSPECKKYRKGWEVKKSDMWAVGIICFILLSGKLPFSGNTQQETLKIIQKGKYEWPPNIELSDSCKDFIASLLCKSTKKRLSAKQALSHEWISDFEHKANDINLLDKISSALKNFNYNNKLHKILVNALLDEIDESEKNIVINAFHNIDINNTGNVEENDIVQYLVLNSNINKKNNKNVDYKTHAAHIINTINKKILTSPNLIKSRSISVQDFVNDITNINMSPPPPPIIPTTIIDCDVDDNDNDNKTDYIHIQQDDDDDSDLELNSDDLAIPTTTSHITVNAFRDIMDKSPKKYPVDNIVNELDPNKTGFISFQSISKFSTMIKTISYDDGFDNGFDVDD